MAGDIESYENNLELELFREYRDVIGLFKYVVETERRFYLCNHVDVQARPVGGDIFFELTLTDELSALWTIRLPKQQDRQTDREARIGLPDTCFRIATRTYARGSSGLLSSSTLTSL